jgi:hypothetical protein
MGAAECNPRKIYTYAIHFVCSQYCAGIRNGTKQRPVIRAVLQFQNQCSPRIREQVLIYKHHSHQNKTPGKKKVMEE